MNNDTLLLRQINENHILDGIIVYGAFKPTTKDEGRLSVDDNDLVTAEESYNHFIDLKNPDTGKNLTSEGCAAVSVGECAQISLPAEPDPDEKTNNPAHAVIDFNVLDPDKELSKNQRNNKFKAKAAQLRHFALQRGEKGFVYKPSQ